MLHRLLTGLFYRRAGAGPAFPLLLSVACPALVSPLFGETEPALSQAEGAGLDLPLTRHRAPSQVIVHGSRRGSVEASTPDPFLHVAAPVRACARVGRS